MRLRCLLLRLIGLTIEYYHVYQHNNDHGAVMNSLRFPNVSTHYVLLWRVSTAEWPLQEAPTAPCEIDKGRKYIAHPSAE